MRYVIQNINADNFKKMGLTVEEKSNGFSVTVNIWDFESNIRKGKFGHILDWTLEQKIKFRKEHYFPVPFVDEIQTFEFNYVSDNNYSCVANERLKNDYQILELIVEAHNDFSGKGWWFCPHGTTNKPIRRKNQRSKAELIVS